MESSLIYTSTHHAHTYENQAATVKLRALQRKASLFSFCTVYNMFSKAHKHLNVYVEFSFSLQLFQSNSLKQFLSASSLAPLQFARSSAMAHLFYKREYQYFIEYQESVTGGESIKEAMLMSYWSNNQGRKPEQHPDATCTDQLSDMQVILATFLPYPGHEIQL